MLFIVLLLILTTYAAHNVALSQWLSLSMFKMRFPGSCRRGQFDCGFNNCISYKKLRDGHSDCFDMSDEYCFPGHVKCGSYCVDAHYSPQCMINPRCDNSATSPSFCSAIKEKLCSVRDTVPCKGYGECVLVKWLMDGKNDCLDGSDEDKDYVIAFGFMSALNWITFQPITPMQHPKPHFSIEHHSPKSGDTQSKSLLQPTEDIGEVDSDKWMLSISHHLKTPFDTHKTTAVNSLSSSNVATDYFHSHFSHHGDTPPANPFSSFYTSLIPLSTPLPATTNPPITDNYPLSVPTKTTLPSSFPSLYVHHIAPPFPPTSSPQNEHLLSSTRYESLTFLHSTLPTSTPLPLHSMPPLFHETTLSALSPFIDQLKSFESSSSLSYPLNPVSLSPPTTLTDNTITNVPLLSSNNPYLHNNVHPVSTPEYTLSPLSFGVPADRLSPQSAFSTIRSPHLIPYISSSESSLLKLNQNHVIQSPLGSHFQTKQPQPSQTNEMTFLSALLSSTPSSASLRFSIIPTQRTSTVDYHHSTATITNEEVKWHILKTKTDECIKSLQKKAMQKYPNPICECPAGQMRVGSAQKCQRLDISTFAVKINQICEQSQPDLQNRASLVMQELSEVFSNEMCIRKDAEEVIVNMLCDNDCLIDDLNALYQNSPHPNVQIRIFELERSACEQPELNDCDSNAECLANNLRYRCICKNDTSSDTTNRSSCNHTAVIPLAAGCFQLFGFCIIFWVMLVLLLLVLLILFLCCAIHRFHHRHQKSTSASENYTANILTVEERRQSSSGSRMINEEKMVQKTSESPINLKDCSELKKVEELKSDNVEIPKRNVDDANITAKCDSNSSMKRVALMRSKTITNDDEDSASITTTVQRQESIAALSNIQLSAIENKNDSNDNNNDNNNNNNNNNKISKPLISELASSAQISLSPSSHNSIQLPTSSDPKLINDPKQRQQQSEEKVDLNSVDEKAVPEDTSRCSSASTPSDSSTPTIWDTFKILGMQYTKRQSIKSQKSCSASLDELIRMRQEEQQQQAFSNDVRTPHNGAQSARLLQNQSADDRSNHMLNLTHTNTNSTNIPSSNGSTPKQESKVSDETTSIVDSSSLMRNTDEVSSKLYQISTAENISEQEQKDNNKSECCESGVRDEEEVVEKRKENEKKGTNDEMQLAIMKRRTPSKDSVLSKLNEVVEKAATLNNNGCQAERVRNGQPIIDNKNKRVDENGKSHHEIDNEAMVRDAKSKMVAKDLTEDEHTLVGANGYCRDRNEPALCTTRMVAGSCVNELLDLVEDSERKELNMAKFDATIKSSERYPTSGREIHSEHGKRTTRRTNKQQQRQHQVSVEQLPQSIATIHEEGISATCAEEKTTANDRGSASCETLLNAPIAATLSPDVNVTVNSDENAAKRLHQGDGDRFIVDHYYRRRYETPERKLSSISEKSAELVNDDDSCTSKSCPATTRVCNHRHTPELKRRFERKFSGYILDERANKAPKNGTRTDELDAEYFRQLPNILSKFRAKPHEDSDGSILEQNKAVLDDSTINSNDQSAKMQPNDSDSIKSIGEQQTNALIQTSGECFTDCKNADKIDEVDEKNSVGGQQTAIPRRAVSRARSRSREGDIRLGSERGRGTRLSCGSEGWRDEGDKEECVNRTCESENGLFKKNASSKRRLSDDKQQHATAIRRKIASRRRESSNLSAISDGACNELRSTNSSIADSDKISLESQKPPWNSSPLREGELDVIAPIKNFIFKTEPDSIQTSLATIQSRSPKQSQRSAVTLPSLSTSPFTTLHQHHLRDRSLSLANVKSKSPRDNRDIWPIRSVVDRLQSNTSLDQPLVKENLWWAHH